MVKLPSTATALLPKISTSRATKATIRTAATLLTLRPHINSKDITTRTNNTGRINSRAIMTRSRAMVSRVTVSRRMGLRNMANLASQAALLKATAALVLPSSEELVAPFSVTSSAVERWVLWEDYSPVRSARTCLATSKSESLMRVHLDVC
jgi:hypothetical protein